jgi:hypothetical protein
MSCPILPLKAQLKELSWDFPVPLATNVTHVEQVVGIDSGEKPPKFIFKFELFFQNR